MPHDSRLSASDHERARPVVKPDQAAQSFLSAKPCIVKACASDEGGLSDVRLTAVLSKGEHRPQKYAGKGSQSHQASECAAAPECLCPLGQSTGCTCHRRGSLATTQLACETQHGMEECADSCPLIDPCRHGNHAGAGNLKQESSMRAELGSLTQLKVCKTPGGTRSISEESWGRPATPDVQPGPGPLKFR